MSGSFFQNPVNSPDKYPSIVYIDFGLVWYFTVLMRVF